MEFKDYYQILGVSDQAPEADIKKAYRKLARKYHPDVSQEAEAEERFKTVSEAWEVLRNPEKRAEYDQLRAMAQQGYAGAAYGNKGQGRAHWQFDESADGFDPNYQAKFSDFFEQIFGRAGAQRSHRTGYEMRGEDVSQTLPLLLEEAFSGCKKQLRISLPVVNPQGEVVRHEKTLKVTVPAGSIDGQQLRLKGQGGPGIGGAPNGDLLLTIQLAPHPRFRVEGRNLISDLSLAPWEAALGASVEVPTLSGPVRLTVPANTQAGQRLKLRGKGLPGDPSGDLLVRVRLVQPAVIDPGVKALYESLAAAHTTFDPRAERASA